MRAAAAAREAALREQLEWAAREAEGAREDAKAKAAEALAARRELRDAKEVRSPLISIDLHRSPLISLECPRSPLS